MPISFLDKRTKVQLQGINIEKIPQVLIFLKDLNNGIYMTVGQISILKP